MFESLPNDPQVFMQWRWTEFEPYFQELDQRPLDQENLHQWLLNWSRLIFLVEETYARHRVATTVDTTDKQAEAAYHAFLDGVYPAAQAADQRLRQKLLESGLVPERFSVPLEKMRVEAGLFREENLPLLSKERKLASEYDRIVGAQTVTWEGQEVTLQQLRPAFQTEDRERRERAWRLSAARQLTDREAINNLWARCMQLRGQLAVNAGLPDYRAYRWQQMLRLDYTPEDCLQFQQAIEQVAVPAATRVYERHRRQLGVEAVRPWDLDLDLYPLRMPALPPYGDVWQLQATAERVFRRVDPQLGERFQRMRSEGLLDLENHKGKAPGAYCTSFPVKERPFIFMNAVGLPTDVRTILHESGHAFHVFEVQQLPYAQQRHPGLEFAEVASMGMELLASPYLASDQGGFYSQPEAARFMVEQLERILIFWPYMAVVDAFQHWVYQNHSEATQADRCDAKWLELWRRFIPGVDWSGLEAEAMTGWHRKQHIFRYPFYYVEYGVAQLGAVQVWRRSLADQGALEAQAGAVADYRRALSLGGTASLPELYETAGARFAFDAGTLGEAVALIEATLERLESKAA